MENKNYVFDFEKLEVYKMSIKFIRKIFEMTKELPNNYAYSIGDQLRRAALSIANNIAEGFKMGDKYEN